MNAILSILMLAAIAMVVGAIMLWRKTGEAKRPLLMALLAVIALVNVAIWTLPDASGESPLAKVEGD